MDQRQAFLSSFFPVYVWITQGLPLRALWSQQMCFFPLLSWYKECNLSWLKSAEHHIISLTQLKIHKLEWRKMLPLKIGCNSKRFCSSEKCCFAWKPFVLHCSKILSKRISTDRSWMMRLPVSRSFPLQIWHIRDGWCWVRTTDHLVYCLIYTVYQMLMPRHMSILPFLL